MTPGPNLSLRKLQWALEDQSWWEKVGGHGTRTKSQGARVGEGSARLLGNNAGSQGSLPKIRAGKRWCQAQGLILSHRT